MDSMGDVFANDYVRVGLPVLMGVAAASSPAGARGAGAMLSSLGALQGISESKARREESTASRTLQERRLAIAEREATEPKYEYRDGEWFVLRQGQEPELIGGGDALTMVSREARQQLGNVITGKAPMPQAAPRLQDTGLPNTLDPDLERQIAAAERDVQAAVPGAEVRREGPATPTTVEPGTSMERINALVRTPDGRAMIYLSRNLPMIKYMESVVKDERELDMAKKRAEMEYDYRMKYYNETFPRELQKSREQQSAGVNIAAQRQAALRGEEEQARLRMSAREAEDAKLIKEIDRYRDIQTGQPLKPSDPYLSFRQREMEGTAKKLTDLEEKEELTLKRTIPILRAVTKDMEKVYGPKGIFERLTPEQRFWAAGEGFIGRVFETNPDLAVAVKNIEGAKARIARIQGETGSLAVRDVMTALEALPSLKGIPNSQEVAYGAMNNLIATANAGFGVLYGNDTFQHPLLPPLVLPPQQTPAPRAATPGQQPKIREDLLQQFQKTP